MAVAGTFWLGAAPALAIPAGECVTAGTGNISITCSGTIPYGVYTNEENTTITLNPDANVSPGSDVAITLGDANSALIMGAGSQAVSSGVSHTVAVSQSGDVTLNGGAAIRLNDSALDQTAAALSVDGLDGANIVLNGGSSINFIGGTYNNKYVDENNAGGINAFGEKISITLNGESAINVTGTGANVENNYYGISVQNIAQSLANRNTITLNGGSSINVHRNGTNTQGNTIGIASYANGEDKYAADITLNSSEINVVGASAADENKYIGIFTGGGLDGRITLNAGSSINVHGEGATQSKYIGIMNVGIPDTNKYASAITLNDSFINVYGVNGTENKYAGIFSIGGNSPITLNGSSQINVGAHYDADLEEWVGGGADAKGYLGIVAVNSSDGVPPTIALNGTSSVNVTGAGNTDGGYYLGIVVGGTGATLTLNGSSSVNVLAQAAAGVVGGVTIYGDNSYVTLNDDSRVNVSVDVGHGLEVNNAVGLLSAGDGNQIVMNDYARISMHSLGSGDVRGTAVALSGDDGTLILNGHAMIEAYNASQVDGVVIDGDNATVTLNDHAVIYGGSAARGIYSDGDNTTVNVGTGTSVVGEVGILLTGNQNNVYVAGQVIGHYDGGSIKAIDVSGGNNSSANLVTLDSAQIIGSVVGGNSDSLTLAGSGTLNEGFNGFGHVTMDGDYWNLAVGSANDAESVDIIAGRLAVNGTLDAGSGLTVHSGGSVGGTGTITGALTVLDGGAVSPGNSPGTLNVVGPVTFNSGSILNIEIGTTAADLLTATGNVTIAPGAIVQPTFFPGADGFVGDIVTSGGTITGTFTPGSGAAIVYSAGVVSLTAASSSSMNGGTLAGVAQGFTFLDTVLSEAQKSASVGKTLWGTALWDRTTRTAASTSMRGFEQHSSGGAFGGDVMDAGDFTLGLAAGYLDGDAITQGGGSRTSITGYHAALYSTYTFGGTYLTSAVTGAYQDQDAKRNVFASGVLVGAQGSPEAWLGGVGLGIGHEFPLNGAFTLTPRASLGYQHMARDGYAETGGGAGALAIDGIDTDTVRGRVGAELAFNVSDPNAMWKVRPQVNAALAREWREGDTTTTGSFRTTGAAFSGDLDSRNQTYLALGAGVDVTVAQGITAFVNYDGGVGGDAESGGGWRLGARMEW